MDSSVFAEYETDLVTVLDSVADKIANEAHSLGGDDRKNLLSRLDRELEEADEIIEQMQLEAQTADKEDKAEFQAKLRDHRATLARHKSDIKSLAASADRDALLASSSAVPRGDHVAIEMDSRSASLSSADAQAQRSRLLSATDKLADGQRRLEESHRVALETEDLGTGILRDLRGQRETLEHTRDTLYEADGSIDRAAGTLKKMMRRATQQRLVTYGILALLVLLMCVAILALGPRPEGAI
ncbi:vesicle transport v-SNARE protein N-terminus-domain-containing protein [Rhodotorula diobovata]|uniref:Vesicle transport v-SNARE protein N-terminus-domain-containing protein n=1 Tax=Rhodotorula diobovata TaxID=5288 RepID=A0A5C5FZB0_9BASI|nr:vesicle transport v-SNARE protein N-terminus-domain-containing protein [Rhodotorula diobovata]